MTDLPLRVVVGKNGAYWRDYGDHYSMCPVSEDNDPVEIVAVYDRPESRAEAWERGYAAAAPPAPRAESGLREIEKQANGLLAALDQYEKDYMTTSTGYTAARLCKQFLLEALRSPAATDERDGLRDHEWCVPHDHVEPDQEKWERDQAATLAALSPDERQPARGEPELRTKAGHQSSVDVGGIVRALEALGAHRLNGLWVQWHGDGTDRVRRKDEVVVSIQYDHYGDAIAEQGEGRSVKEATDNLIAALATSSEPARGEPE